ncbi:MAG TPA: GNAT family N-acetyltransferase [Anaerolineales bacterium]|nr:GNAT family N-acetyltransferase [Anaerolineales bacterium]
MIEQKITTPHGIITLRQAAETDAMAFRELRLEALQNNPVAFSSDFSANAEQPDQFWLERIQKLGDEGTIFFVEHDNSLLGMCGIQKGYSIKTRHSGLIWGVFVKPAWRGAGIAQHLIEACINWAKNHEVTVVKLGVAATNISAIRCYASCGFLIYGIEPQAIQYENTMVDELLMARDIRK